MVSKCANPDCSTPLQYLRDGKVFRVEVQEISSAPAGSFLVSGKKKSVKRVEHFWLCGACARTMNLSFDKDNHISVVPKERPLRHQVAAAS
jgi:hypothetical protein